MLLLAERSHGHMRPTQSVEVQEDALGVLQLKKIRSASLSNHSLDPKGGAGGDSIGIRSCLKSLQKRCIGGAPAYNRSRWSGRDVERNSAGDLLALKRGLQGGVGIIHHGLRDADELRRRRSEIACNAEVRLGESSNELRRISDDEWCNVVVWNVWPARDLAARALGQETGAVGNGGHAHDGG